MPAPDLEPTFVAKVVDWLWAIVLGTIGLLWKNNESKLQTLADKLDKKADAQDVKEMLRHIDRLYEQAETGRVATRDYYDKAMNAMREQQSEFMQAINSLRNHRD